MNKEELVNAIAFKTRATKKDTDQFLNALIDTVMNTVSDGEKVTLIGFGNFEPVVRKEREGRNPATGASLTIPKTRVPKFTAGKTFKDRVADPMGVTN